ncbi:hypothetical protein TrRE_jg11465 [Triparma retinervis]|uniref:Pseudouridine synthase RsuA/RluA-like domain-containing protein n=1 Tax=Triparma retinervis TaxID=2557542 RepID=A0A9W7AEP5_9STRA|nr:hypothetical protein TrRE_jg11465 [Triparma retinervis]
MGKKGRVQLARALEMMGKAKGRRDAKRLIGSGRVLVMGMVAKSAAMKVDVENLEAEVKVLEVEVEEEEDDDEILSKRQKVVKVVKEEEEEEEEEESAHQFCVAYNKPCGMECTCAEGENGIKTLLDVHPSLPSPHYKAVGRLDRHSCGLLLFSRFGALTSALLAPKTAVEREYEIVVRGDVGEEGSEKSRDIARRVEEGVETDYGKFKGRVRWMKRCDEGELWEHRSCMKGTGGERNDRWNDGEANEGEEGGLEGEGGEAVFSKIVFSKICVIVGEGKKRMVRRLFAGLAENLHVVNLRRVRYGGVTLGELDAGRWRKLTEKETEFCKVCVKGFVEGGKEWN